MHSVHLISGIKIDRGYTILLFHILTYMYISIIAMFCIIICLGFVQFEKVAFDGSEMPLQTLKFALLNKNKTAHEY